MQGKELIIEQVYACLVDADSSLKVAAQMCDESEFAELEEMVRPLFRLRGEIHTKFLRLLYKKYPALESKSKNMYLMSHAASQDYICDSKAAKTVGGLSDKQLSTVDDILMDLVKSNWQKTASVIGNAMIRLSDDFMGVSDVLYGSRLARLHDEKKIEVNGDLRRMRMSEIRTPMPDSSRPET